MKNVLGYGFLGVIFLCAAFLYQRSAVAFLEGFPTVVLLSGALSVVAVTINIFFFWEEKVIRWLASKLGPVGHALICGYCLNLWLALIVTGVFRPSLFDRLVPPFFDFLFTWWGLSAVSTLFFEVITLLWFKKVLWEYEIRKLNKQTESERLASE